MEPVSGTIIVDGENLSHMGLHDCRSKITILPQVGLNMSGTLFKFEIRVHLYTCVVDY